MLITFTNHICRSLSSFKTYFISVNRNKFLVFTKAIKQTIVILFSRTNETPLSLVQGKGMSNYSFFILLSTPPQKMEIPVNPKIYALIREHIIFSHSMQMLLYTWTFATLCILLWNYYTLFYEKFNYNPWRPYKNISKADRIWWYNIVFINTILIILLVIIAIWFHYHIPPFDYGGICNDAARPTILGCYWEIQHLIATRRAYLFAWLILLLALLIFTIIIVRKTNSKFYP